MKKKAIDHRKKKEKRIDITDLLRSMEAVGPTLPTQRLDGDLRRCVIGVTTTLSPGQKSVISAQPLQYGFQLDYVLVPESVTFDEQGKLKLLFHHEQLVMDGKMPASFVLNRDSEHMQKRDIYRKHVFAAGEIFELGVFENIGAEPLVVRAAVMGFAKANLT